MKNLINFDFEICLLVAFFDRTLHNDDLRHTSQPHRDSGELPKPFSVTEAGARYKACTHASTDQFEIVAGWS